MSQQQFSPTRSQSGQFAQQQQQQQAPLSPSSQQPQSLSNGGATAVLYGPPLSRTRASDVPEIAAHRAEYDARLSELDRARSEAERHEAAAQWDRQQRLQGPGLHGGHPRTAFYNTADGADLIAAARRDLSARAKPVDRHMHRSTVEDNRQRAYHAECVLAQNLAKARPSDAAEFVQFPLAEYNRFNLAARTWSGPETHVRVKPAPYTAPRGPRKLDVARRHDLIANLNKNHSNNNYDHGRPFVAKHTNNLLSC